MYGLGIKQQLQDYYDDEVNHGRLYPNLDNLVERDFLHKRSLDDRTNEYAITERGLAAILDRTEWEIEQLVEDQEAIEQLIELLESAVNDH